VGLVLEYMAAGIGLGISGLGYCGGLGNEIGFAVLTGRGGVAEMGCINSDILGNLAFSSASAPIWNSSHIISSSLGGPVGPLRFGAVTL
jgi:hypothetical protein